MMVINITDFHHKYSDNIHQSNPVNIIDFSDLGATAACLVGSSPARLPSAAVARQQAWPAVCINE